MKRTPRETSRRCMRLRWGGWRATSGSLLPAGAPTSQSRGRWHEFGATCRVARILAETHARDGTNKIALAVRVVSMFIGRSLHEGHGPLAKRWVYVREK